jgi:hypothetical protein
MKKIKLLFGIALIAMFGVFTSCEEDTTATIDITPTSMPDTIEAGVETTLKFSIFSDENLEKIELRKGVETLVEKTEEFSEKTADNFSYSGVLADSTEAGTTISFALIVTDKQANQESYNFDIPVKSLASDEEPTEITVTSYTGLKIYGALADGTNDDLFSVETGSIYNYNELSSEQKSLIDFVYAYSDLKAFSNQLVSPADLPSSYHDGGTLPNTTNMVVVNDVTFADVTGDDIVNNISNITNVNATVAVDDVVAFITEAGHKGYIKIKSIEDPDGDGYGTHDDYIEFDVKAVLAEDMPSK